MKGERPMPSIMWMFLPSEAGRKTVSVPQEEEPSGLSQGSPARSSYTPPIPGEV